MQRGLSLAALASACIFGSSSAGLAEVTGVSTSANAWDTRTTRYGCAPDGCVAANVLDGSIEDESRWSCREAYMDVDVDVCELTLALDEPTDISEMRMAMFKGDERNRTVNVWVDGVLSTTVETRADTLEYETYELSATQASTIVLQDAGVDPVAWLSIMEVKLMTDYDVDESLTGVVPTSGDYVGCYNDLIGDRVLTTVSTDDALTPAACEAACAETSRHYYGLQQGNECWCAGCDLTELDTYIDYDRHGEGSCSTPCAGDATSTCGGDFAISLYQTTTCQTTPAPTPAIVASECPSGSTQAALEIAGTWDNGFALFLYVIEPGGAEVGYMDSLGDVGMYCGGNGGFGYSNPGSKSYLSLNGLNVADDAVLGDYTVWGRGSEGTIWSITAWSRGELLWTAGGVLGENERSTDLYTATVTSYADSDCTVDAYDVCPSNTYSEDSLPPCTHCPDGLKTSSGSTYCTVPALSSLNVPETVKNDMISDAVGGFAGSGTVELYPDSEKMYNTFITEGADSGTISMSGNFRKDDDTALPESTGLYLYLYNEDSPTDVVRGQGVVDAASGNFTATIVDIPVGYSKGILSFVALEVDDGGDILAGNSVFDIRIVNEGCSNELRIKLEWDSDDGLDLWVTDPNGDRAIYGEPNTVIGYTNNRNGGGYNFVNYDTGSDYSYEEFVLFSGLSGDAMLGDYDVFARRDYGRSGTTWTLTVTMNGAVVSIETGVLDGSSSIGTADDDSSSRRQLITDDDDNNSYYYSSYPQTDTMVVTLASYDPVGC